MVATTDGGQSWRTDPVATRLLLTDLFGNRYPIGQGNPYLGEPAVFAFDPTDDRIIVIGTVHVGLLVSVDAGASWGRVPVIAPRVSSVVFSGLRGRFYVSTYGRGVWDVTIGGTSLALGEAITVSAVALTGGALVRWSAGRHSSPTPTGPSCRATARSASSWSMRRAWSCMPPTQSRTTRSRRRSTCGRRRCPVATRCAPATSTASATTSVRRPSRRSRSIPDLDGASVGQGDGERAGEIDVLAGGIDRAGREDAIEGGVGGGDVTRVGLEDGGGRVDHR